MNKNGENKKKYKNIVKEKSRRIENSENCNKIL